MAVVAQSGTPIDVSYTNALPFTYPSWIPVDTRLTPLGNQLRVMTHLHGALVAGTSDGTPSVMPNGFGTGDTQPVHYPNEQPATLLWFHDHALAPPGLTSSQDWLLAIYFVINTTPARSPTQLVFRAVPTKFR